jgi:hypothetical protein
VLSGWFTAEVGRQPWVVWGLLRTTDAVTPTLTGPEVLATLIGYVVVYTVIFAFGMLYIYELLHEGPTDDDTRVTGAPAMRPMAAAGPLSIAAADDLICAVLRGESRSWPSAFGHDFAEIFLRRAAYHGVFALLHDAQICSGVYVAGARAPFRSAPRCGAPQGSLADRRTQKAPRPRSPFSSPSRLESNWTAPSTVSRRVDAAAPRFARGRDDVSQTFTNFHTLRASRRFCQHGHKRRDST